jgi:hypothetical protein
MPFRRQTGLMLAAVGSLTFTIWLGWHVTSAEAAKTGALGTKVVDMIEVQRVWDAVRITKVAVAGQPIGTGLSGPRGEYRQGPPFQADEDWLKNMTISLNNRTDKPITCAQLRLWFPDTGDGTATRSITNYVIKLGQRPESALHYADGSKIPPDQMRPLLLTPSETLLVHVGDYIEEIKATVESLGNIQFSQVTRVNIEPTDFYFTDGMRWVGHTYYTPDPDHPGIYTKLADTYFPGSAARTRTLQ